jgi:hypothetical protein
MPKFNRRHFLQILGAAGLAPALPALRAPAAVSGGATHAQMMWASMYARSGSAAKFASTAQTMGLSDVVARNVYARIAQSPVLTTQSLVRAAKPATPAARASTQALKPQSAKLDLREIFREDEVEENDVVEQTDAPDIAPDVAIED